MPARLPYLAGITGAAEPVEWAAVVNIVVQDKVSFRFDPQLLRRPGTGLVLLVSPGKHRELRHRGHERAFDLIRVTEDFTPEAIAAFAREVAGRALSSCRLLCHEEYTSVPVAAARELLGIGGTTPAQTAGFVDKIRMKEIAGRRVRVPRHLRWDRSAHATAPEEYLRTIVDSLGLPVFAKPVGGCGSLGTARLDDPAHLAAWASSLPDGTDFEVDEFLEGTLYHVDSVVVGDEVLFTGVHRYLHPCHEYFSGKIVGTCSVPAGEPVHDRLVGFNERVLDAYGADRPDRSVTHLEVFERRDGELVFLEIAARAPGAMAPLVSEKRWGLNIELAHFRLQLGEVPDLPGEPRCSAGFVYFPRPAGVVGELSLPELASEHTVTRFVRPGERTRPSRDVSEAVAGVLLWNPDHQELLADLERLDSASPVQPVP